MKGQAGMGDTVVGVYYRPPDREEEADEAFYRWLTAASQSQALDLMGDFNSPDICWKASSGSHPQSRRFLQCHDDNFMMQMVEEPTGRGTLLDLIFTNKEGLVEAVKGVSEESSVEELLDLGDLKLDSGPDDKVVMESEEKVSYSGLGAHTLQEMIGCDLLEDGSIRGYYQSAYDGKDFIALDKDSMSFSAADAAAVVTKRKWEEDGTVAEEMKHYLENTCMEWLRRYLSYGQAELERKEPPTVRVIRKETQGTLTLSCRVYGFYPRPIAVSWLKGTEVRDQDTQRGSIAPNSDGTFFTWASIEVLPQERDLYRCRVEHSSLPQPGLYSWEPQAPPLSMVLAVVAAMFAALAVVGIGIGVWKRRSGQQLKGYNLTAPGE
ncbi:class I histocompatibility antigen, F10 alpha chain-like [Indicator indicator]|uniref:class I histocompatibility antigen, F10 alpha chain-like n=1 Tax=Indicator indicator TaxID=1002788 RepID=UPI0023DFF1AA|nr:class I histocompatibility antigen, F10 alpha chain-like [Indicator indicator]